MDAIAARVADMPAAKRATVLGAVHYDANAARALGVMGGRLAISYGPIETPGGLVGRSAHVVGKMTVDTLRAAGLSVEWDSNPDHVIVVVAG